MSIFTATDFQRIAVSSVGALIVSAACVFGAVGPVHAAAPNAPVTIADWQARVDRSIDRTMRLPERANIPGGATSATVEIRLNASGDVETVSLASTSGRRALDREALRVARTISYPALPEGMRGQPQRISMKLNFAINDKALADLLRHRGQPIVTAKKASPTEVRTAEVQPD